MLGVLTLLPAVSVFAYAYGLVNRSIDKWLSFPVDEIVFTSLHMDEIIQQWQREKWQQENAQALLADLANHIPSDFEKTRKLFQLKALALDKT